MFFFKCTVPIGAQFLKTPVVATKLCQKLGYGQHYDRTIFSQWPEPTMMLWPVACAKQGTLRYFEIHPNFVPTLL